MLPGTGGTTPGGKRASDRVGDPGFEGYEQGHSLTDGSESYGGEDALNERLAIVDRHMRTASAGRAGQNVISQSVGGDEAATPPVMAAPVPGDLPEHEIQHIVTSLEREEKGVYERTTRDGETVVQFTFGDGDRVAASAPGIGTDATREAVKRLARKVGHMRQMADEEGDDNAAE